MVLLVDVVATTFGESSCLIDEEAVPAPMPFLLDGGEKEVSTGSGKLGGSETWRDGPVLALDPGAMDAVVDGGWLLAIREGNGDVADRLSALLVALLSSMETSALLTAC